MTKSKKIIIGSIAAIVLIAVAVLMYFLFFIDRPMKYTDAEKKEIREAIELAFDNLSENELLANYAENSTLIEGVQNAVINSAQKAEIQAKEVMNLINSVPNFLEIILEITPAQIVAAYDTGYQDGYKAGYWRAMYRFDKNPPDPPYPNRQDYVDGFYCGYEEGYNKGSVDTYDDYVWGYNDGYRNGDNDHSHGNDFDPYASNGSEYNKGYFDGYTDGYNAYTAPDPIGEFSEVVERLSEVFGDYEKTGVNGTKMGKFTYSMIVELHGIVIEIICEETDLMENECLEPYEEFMGCFTEEEFVLVFAASYDSGITIAQAVLSNDIFDIVTNYAKDETLPTESEFRAIFKAKIDEMIKSASYYNDDVYNAMGKMAKSFNSAFSTNSSAQIKKDNKEIDNIITVGKAGNKAALAMLKELKSDDYAINNAYDISTASAKGESLQDAMLYDLVICFAKLANTALNNGLSQENILLLIEIYYSDYDGDEVADMISAIKELKNVKYGDDLKEYKDNLFVLYFFSDL